MSVLPSLGVPGLGHACISDGTERCLGVQEGLGVTHVGVWKPSTNNSSGGRGISLNNPGGIFYAVITAGLSLSHYTDVPQ